MFNASIYRLDTCPPETRPTTEEVPRPGDDPPRSQAGALAHLPEPEARKIGDFSPPPAYDVAGFRTQLNDWLDLYGPVPVADDVAEASAELSAAFRVSEDLRSAFSAALAMATSHSLQLLMMAVSNHPLVRLSAVSHPFVLGTLLEGLLKKLFDVTDPDPETRSGARFKEKVTAALVNWNFVQPTIDAMLKSPYAWALKISVSASISGTRDLVERENTRQQMAELPPDTPPGPRKLSDMESLFINTLMCMLRNVGFDAVRQVVKSQGLQMLPEARSLQERALRNLMLGAHVSGGLPSGCVVLQVLPADAVRSPEDPDKQADPPDRAFDAHNPF